MKALICLFVVYLSQSAVFAQQECPWGLSNDSYPGRCGLYVDNNKDGLCDRGVESKAISTATTIIPPVTTTSSASAAKTLQMGGGYDFINVSVLMMAAYLISFILNRTGSITIRSHRMLWNILLLFTFLVSAILGIILVLRINYGIVVQLPINMLYWHVEAGIAMTVISVFHILWHMDYFKSILRPKVVAPISKERKKRGKIAPSSI
jgi:hypothetical protein